MKKLATTFGLLALMLIVTSFTTPTIGGRGTAGTGNFDIGGRGTAGTGNFDIGGRGTAGTGNFDIGGRGTAGTGN